MTDSSDLHADRRKSLSNGNSLGHAFAHQSILDRQRCPLDLDQFPCGNFGTLAFFLFHIACRMFMIEANSLRSVPHLLLLMLRCSFEIWFVISHASLFHSSVVFRGQQRLSLRHHLMTTQLQSSFVVSSRDGINNRET